MFIEITVTEFWETFKFFVYILWDAVNEKSVSYFFFVCQIDIVKCQCELFENRKLRFSFIVCNIFWIYSKLDLRYNLKMSFLYLQYSSFERSQILMCKILHIKLKIRIYRSFNKLWCSTFYLSHQKVYNYQFRTCVLYIMWFKSCH